MWISNFAIRNPLITIVTMLAQAAQDVRDAISTIREIGRASCRERV